MSHETHLQDEVGIFKPTICGDCRYIVHDVVEYILQLCMESSINDTPTK